MDQLTTTSSSSLEEKGRKLYKQNPHFRKLSNIMEHPEFRDFYNTYMKDWENTKVVLMFMKLYEAIETHSNVKLSPFEKISIMKNIIDNGETRREICKGISDWTELKSNVDTNVVTEAVTDAETDAETDADLGFAQEKCIVRKSS
jgi:hypothetical protein